MAEKQDFYRVTDYGDNVKPADNMKIERHIYFQSENADISRFAALPLERLQAMRGESVETEQRIFAALRVQAGTWENQAAVTLLLDKAIEYVKTPAVSHSSNQWVKDRVNNDFRSMSNMVYKMATHVSVNTPRPPLPMSWDLTWSVRTNTPDGHRSDRIAGQDRKHFTDIADMEKYLNGRIKAYSHLFTEISPPIPQGYAKNFCVNGQLLPGYTVEGEEPKRPDRAADLADGVSIVERKLNKLLKESDPMNEPLNIKLSTREIYEAGGTDGAWLKLPATAEQLTAALARIGAQGGDFIISAFEANIPALQQIPIEYMQSAGIDKLNFLAARLEMFDAAHSEKLNAAIEIMPGVNDIHQLTEYTFCPDYYEFYPDIHTYAELGEHVLNHSGLIQIPDEWAAALDREKLGRIADGQDKGLLSEKGYIVPSGGEWYSLDKNDIPQDYRITPKTEKPDMEQDAITTRTAAAVTAKPPERTQTTAVIPLVLTSENPRDRMKEITDKLEAGIKGIFDSEKYKDYLQTLSKFHNYSFNNCLLIAMQKPDASHVAGFNDWRDNFKRQVKKGEKGIKILAPAPFKTKKMLDAVDADGKPVFDNSGRRKKEEKEITVPAFKIVSVFDVSQTDGEPLPQIGVNELTGSVDRYKEFLAAVEKTSPVPVSFETLAPGVKGTFYQDDKRIAINEGMSELQNLKTLVHEITHARLHDIDKNAPKDAPRPDRDTREVQAESIAYAVCLHYGLDTSGYSFGYVAEWSGNKELDILKSSLDTIRKEANAIITEVDKHFTVLSQDREQTAIQGLEQETKAMLQMFVDNDIKDHGAVQPGTLETLTVQGYEYRDGQLEQAAPAPEHTAPQGDTFTIYQLNDSNETRDIRFAELAAVTAVGLAVAVANYDKIYSAPLDSGVTLDDIYMDFNMGKPEGFTGHSLSVSDVIVINKDGKETAHYVDNIGFQELSGFLAPIEQAQEKTSPSVDLKAVADFMQKQYDYAQGADPTSQAAVATVSIITRRLEQVNERIPDTQPQLKALLSLAAQSPDLATLKERMNTLQTEFTQHYSTAVQMTIDTSGKAEPTLPKETLSDHIADVTVSKPPAPKAPAQGENVAAIEARVNAGEVINITDLSDAIKKDKAAAKDAPTTPKAGTRGAAKNETWRAAQAQDAWDRAQTPKAGQPSIKDKIAAGKEEIAAKKSAPAKAAAQNKNAGLGE